MNRPNSQGRPATAATVERVLTSAELEFAPRRRFSTYSRPLTRRARRMFENLAIRVAAPVAACAFVLGFGPAVASVQEQSQKIGDTTVFSTLPFPGHPFGIVVDTDRIYVDTSRGDFFASQTNSAGERVFALDKHGDLLQTTTIPTMPDATMGLWGLALDGNKGRAHQLYVADMNGRILRLHIGQKPPTFEVFSTPPAPFNTGDWHTTMWNDLTFDHAGNLLMTDDKPRLWRVAPDGTASVYFTDPRLLGQFHFAGGPLGGRIDPSGSGSTFRSPFRPSFRATRSSTACDSWSTRSPPTWSWCTASRP